MVVLIETSTGFGAIFEMSGNTASSLEHPIKNIATTRVAAI